ncbi:hypothetical protein CMV_013782 [Castanea mollissima]|uniref:N-acetyltransferase domain-containing protein n=1 Tax=Castanea mollissima TaxID=60419 RepID=A0A8J4QYU8_9ROSI|nr:hypothetical protein CMV_013782 [Castanea mollissima]
MSLSPIHLLHLSLTHHSTQIAASLLSLSEGPCILLAAFNLQSLLLLTSAPPPPPPPQVDTSLLNVAEAFSEDQLWAASCLRVRSFYNFTPTAYAIHDHKRDLAQREFEALKERVAGKREGFRRVSCINATLPLSELSSFSDDLCAECKFSDNGEDRVVVGTLDLNQCLRLPDEITGMKPEGIGADFLRAYLSNVCVAKELHRNGLGYSLVAKSKIVAQDWGITDLYVHVAIDNEPAKNLYMKSSFVYEMDEPAWQARFLDRPRRLLLWTGLPGMQL